MSFIFYDTETTGTNTAFDQILQFGAIRTDHELNELDRFEIRCRLLSHVVPAPTAMLVTNVDVEKLINPALPSHYEMVRAIKAKLEEWSPGIFIGHNSLSFDEHLLRHAFYKTLHAPYLTNTNGNCRTDSLRMIQAVTHFAPGTLTIPQNDRGMPIFKLDQLAAANGLDNSAAHDAIADAGATIHICKMIAEREPGYWSGFVRFAQKAAVTEFMQEEKVILLTDFYFGKPYSWMVTCIGVNPERGSELVVFNLSIDPDELAILNNDELYARLTELPKPVRSIRTNAGPIVLPYEDVPEALKDVAPDFDVLQERATRLKDNDRLCERLIVAFIHTREKREPSIYVEEQIYDDFSSDDDKAVMDRFHALDWPHRIQLLDQISDERMRLLGQQLIYAEAPTLMSEAAHRKHEIAIACRLMTDDETVPWLTYPKAIKEVDNLLTAAGNGSALLADLRQYLIQQAEEASSLLA